jgi:hypothetical protein
MVRHFVLELQKISRSFFKQFMFVEIVCILIAWCVLNRPHLLLTVVVIFLYLLAMPGLRLINLRRKSGMSLENRFIGQSILRQRKLNLS